MKIHLKTVLSKMFDAVEEDTSNIELYVDDPNWFVKNDWTKTQEDTFKIWLLNYISENSGARKEFDIIIKNKFYYKKFVDGFCSNYGWKIKE